MKKDPIVAREMLIPFIMVTSLFALWGFANDITNPLVQAFEDIFLISSFESGFVQTAFYGGYATMAIPAAIFITRYTYKSGILMGLLLYALGAFLFIPAAFFMQFWLFLISFYVLTFGLAFLETTANPYILSMGSSKTATRRLNLAQAFNPIGSLTGMTVSSVYILNQLEVSKFRAQEMLAHPEYESMHAGIVSEKIRESLETLSETNPDVFLQMQSNDLEIIQIPYVAIGLVVSFMFFIFAFKKMPQTTQDLDHKLDLKRTFFRLVRNRCYFWGVIAQLFYVGAQIMCWTFIIHYAVENYKMSAASAQNYNICAMLIFCASRFIFTYLMKFISPGTMLFALSVAAIALLFGVIYLHSMLGLYCLIGVSACMSIMFPSIYGLALDRVGRDAKLASSGLIFAIVGGALMPPIQGLIIDANFACSISSTRLSFYLPMLCFAVIAIYGYFNSKNTRKLIYAKRNIE